jgi:hypothetical protein
MQQKTHYVMINKKAINENASAKKMHFNIFIFCHYLLEQVHSVINLRQEGSDYDCN